MANVNIPRPTAENFATPEKAKEYITNILEELDYILTNLDEDNMTKKFNQKIGGKDGVQK